MKNSVAYKKKRAERLKGFRENKISRMANKNKIFIWRNNFF